MGKIAESDAAVAAQKARIAARQAVGAEWDGKADNDNIAWPLAKALLAEGRHDLLKYAMRYRQIEASATGEAGLRGEALQREAVGPDRDARVMDNGDIVYRGAKKLTAQRFAAQPPTHNHDKVGAPWNGDDTAIAAIDAKKMLPRLRARLGAIVEPFEELVLHGATLAKAGRAMGVGNDLQAGGAARAIAHVGLFAVADELGAIDREDLAA